MSGKFFLLCFLNLFQFVNSKAVFVDKSFDNSKFQEENFISISSNKKNDCVKKFYKGVTFKTPNGLVITYFGSRYSVDYLKNFLNSCRTNKEEFVKLNNLGFDKISFLSKDHLEVKDSLKIESVDFLVTYEDDNQIKVKRYSKSNSPLSYYNQYLQFSGLNLDNQSLQPINLCHIKSSIERLKLHFIRLGYSYVDIGYKLIQDKKTKHLRVVYNIDLGSLQANSIQFIGGNSSLNNILRGKYPRYHPAIFEITNNYLFVYNFIEVIKKQYFDLGYYNITVDSYFDQYQKEFVYLIDAGDRFSIDKYQIDTSVCDFVIPDKKKQQIEGVISKDSRLYNDKKRKSIELILSSLYDKKECFLRFSLRKNYSNKTLSMIFSFERRKVNPNKILASIKCTGNSNISSNRIKAFLGKKIGDMISNDDIDLLERNLLRTGCFKHVDLKLKDVEDHYELVVDVKENNLVEIKNVGLNCYPNLAANISFNKKNLADSGKSLDFTLNIQSTDTENQCVIFDLGFSDVLPNGNVYSYGVSAQYNGNFIEKVKAQNVKLFDQDSGGNVYMYLDTELLGFDNRFQLGYRHFINNKGICYLNLNTLLFDNAFSTYNYLTHFSIRNELVFHLEKNNVPQDRVTAFFDYYYFFSNSFKFQCKLQAGHLVSSWSKNDKNNQLSKYYKFQGFHYFDIGCWGPKEGGYIVGGDSKIGSQLKLTYDLNFNFMPTFLVGSLLFGQFEIASIFNARTGKVKENCVYGLASGLEFPFFNNQINLRFFYFYPLHKNSADSLTKRGWQLGMTLAINPFG